MQFQKKKNPNAEIYYVNLLKTLNSTLKFKFIFPNARMPTQGPGHV